MQNGLFNSFSFVPRIDRFVAVVFVSHEGSRASSHNVVYVCELPLCAPCALPALPLLDWRLLRSQVRWQLVDLQVVPRMPNTTCIALAATAAAAVQAQAIALSRLSVRIVG